MLRTYGIRSLDSWDTAEAMSVCARNPVTNVFVAARLEEGSLKAGGAALGLGDRHALESLVWCGANAVPVEVADDDIPRYAARLKRQRRRFSSLFGPAESVLPLWSILGKTAKPPMSFRPEQPLMVADASWPSLRTVAPDPRVRAAFLNETDAVVPAAAAMFTEEIGYPPFTGSPVAYRAQVAKLIAARRTFVLIENGKVRFKADAGSVAGGVAQIQGVWVDPAWRGRGMAAPCMAAVVKLVQESIAPTVSLYVNDYNVPAVRAYRRAGFERVGTFATIIM